MIVRGKGNGRLTSKFLKFSYDFAAKVENKCISRILLFSNKNNFPWFLDQKIAF